MGAVSRGVMWAVIGGIIAAVVIVALAAVSPSPPRPEEIPSEPLAQPRIVIKAYDIGIRDAGVDKLYLGDVDVLLRNQGSASAAISGIVVSSGEGRIECPQFGSLDPGEEDEFSLTTCPYTEGLKKEIGVDEVEGKVSIIGYVDSSKAILAEKNVIIQIPTARIGDTIQEINSGNHNLSLTLLSWKESDIAIDGPYGSGYYTFTAKPGMKFVILTYEFQNNWIRPQSTPYLNAGEIGTNKGYIYTTWDPPLGVHSEEYKPRLATDEEVKTLVGDSGGYEDLLPEESVAGRVVFEIPEGETPVEASIVYVPPLIKYSRD